jgi:hypothetical protein
MAVTDSYYPAEMLYKNIDIDENGDSSASFMDKSKRTILQVRFLNNDVVKTYYIYDDFGQLRYVVSP